jgi:hypothetical protein
MDRARADDCDLPCLPYRTFFPERSMYCSAACDQRASRMEKRYFVPASCRSVKGRFSSTGQRSDPLLAAAPVERLSGVSCKVAVYDLTVEDEPEFFAGGILVHNCAIAFAGRANAAPMNVESHAGESITGDLMTKAW